MRSPSFAFLSLCLAVAGCRSDGLASGHSSPDPNPPASCSTLTDATSCDARSDCEIAGCPGCDGKIIFSACIDPATAISSGALYCPRPACGDCAQETTESGCDAHTGCFAIYADAGTCDCNVAGCCMAFDRCVSTPASCAPTNAQPCATPSWDCGPEYDPVYEGACMIGCAKLEICKADCRTQGCDPSETCEICWSGYACLPDGAVC